MTTFIIDEDNTVTAYTDAPTGIEGMGAFTSEKQLAELSAAWPAARLVAVWNCLAGAAPSSDLRPVKKFTDRKSAVSRIWKVLPHLTPVCAPQPPQVRPESPLADSDASATAGRNDGRSATKSEQVLELLRRPSGATLPEIIQATGWQAHTVRGYISGTVSKKLGLTVVSSRGDDKQRTYRIHP